MSTLKRFYRQAVNAETLTESLESAIVSYGSNHDESLLISLTSRKGLRAATRNVLGASKSAAVKAAWYANAGFSSEELKTLVAKEKRATVLAALASSTEASLELLGLLAKDKRPSVTQAVLSNPNSSLEVAASALENFLHERILNYSQIDMVKQLLKEHPELCEVAAKNTVETMVLNDALVAVSGFEVSTVEVLVERWVVPAVSKYNSLSSSQSSYQVRTVLGAAANVAARLLSGPVEGQVLVARTLAPLGEAVLRSLVSRPRAGFDVDKILSLTGSSSDRAQAAQAEAKRVAALKALSETSDFTQFEEVLEKAFLQAEETHRRTPYGYVLNEELKALLKNPSLPYSLILRLAKITPHSESLVGLRNRLPEVKTREQAAVEAVCLHRFGQYMFNTLPKLDTDWGMLLDACYEINETETFSFAVFPVDERVPLEVVFRLPWKYVSANAPSRVVEKVAEVLGDSPQSWELFESISKNFEGSLKDLLDVVGELS